MKTKKNAGFSLVELIVVIAIMAVLVGVLAPAYLKYVEKSRKSTDVSAVADIITAASTVAADVEFDIPANSRFIASIDGNGKITLKCQACSAATFTEDPSATSGWKSVAKCENGYTCKSKEFKAGGEGSITGTVQTNGSVDWELPTSGSFKAMVDYSKDLKSKFE